METAMSQNLPMREQIITVAERRVRSAGFPAMSFRDIALEVGIKSSSVHYHFSTKEDLGVAILETYTARFKCNLDSIVQDDLATALNQFVCLYGDGLVMDEAICLCAILGAEALGLPKNMNKKTKSFFAMSAAWLNALFARHGIDEENDLAFTMISALEGAIIVASSSNDRAIFDAVANKMLQVALGKHR